MRAVLFALACLGLAGGAAAEPSGFDWTATMQFDANKVVGRNGGSLGVLMSEFYGAAAMSGAVVMRGHVTYETASPPQAASGAIAGYQNAITSMSVQIGAITSEADLPMIARNYQTSREGLTLFTDQSFCSDADKCSQMGLPFAPWGMLFLVMDNIATELTDEYGTTRLQGDTLFMSIGRTAGTGEFTPPIQTTNFGVVSVDGLSVAIFSRPGGQLFAGRDIPHMRQLLGSTQLGRTEVWVFLEGPALLGRVKIEGSITAFEIDR